MRWPSLKSSDHDEADLAKSIEYLGGRAAAFCLALESEARSCIDQRKLRPTESDVTQALLKVKKSKTGYHLMSALLSDFGAHHPTAFRTFFANDPDLKQYLFDLDFELLRGHTIMIWEP